MGRKKDKHRSRSSSRGRSSRKKKKHSDRERRKGSRAGSSERNQRQSDNSPGHKGRHRRESYSSNSDDRDRSPGRKGRHKRRHGRSRSCSLSRDGQTRSNRSRSQSHDRKRHGRSRSRSYDRKAGRHGDRSRSRSHDRDRVRHDRSHDNRRGHGRSRSSGRHKRSHSRSSSRRRRSRSRSEYRDRRQGNVSRDRERYKIDSNNAQHSKESISKEKKKSESLSKDIPGYASMTPAERVKAKMKAMLEKSTSALSKVKVEEERRETFVPTSAQLEMIEAESFENTKFVSHRTAGKAVPVMTSSDNSIKISKGGGSFNPREVDASEYEPQVVELPEEVDTGGGGRSVGEPHGHGDGPMCAYDDDHEAEAEGGDSPGGKEDTSCRGSVVKSDSNASSGSSGTDSEEDSSASLSGAEDCGDRTASNGKAAAAGDGDEDTMDLACRDLSDEEREKLWWHKLIEMRERYLATMTDEERDDFLKSLEV